MASHIQNTKVFFYIFVIFFVANAFQFYFSRLFLQFFIVKHFYILISGIQ